MGSPPPLHRHLDFFLHGQRMEPARNPSVLVGSSQSHGDCGSNACPRTATTLSRSLRSCRRCCRNRSGNACALPRLDLKRKSCGRWNTRGFYRWRWPRERCLLRGRRRRWDDLQFRRASGDWPCARPRPGRTGRLCCRHYTCNWESAVAAESGGGDGWQHLRGYLERAWWGREPDTLLQ